MTLEKAQEFANKLQNKLQEKYGDGQVSVQFNSFANEVYVTMTAQGKSDTYTIYQNDIDKHLYFIRNFNGVL